MKSDVGAAFSFNSIIFYIADRMIYVVSLIDWKIAVYNIFLHLMTVSYICHFKRKFQDIMWPAKM